MFKNKKDKVIVSLINKMNKSGYIKKEDFDIYIYGLDAFFMLSISTIIVFTLGILLRKTIFTICFFITFTIMRTFIGGIHLNCRIKCFFCSIALYLFAVCLSYFNINITFVTAVISIALILKNIYANNMSINTNVLIVLGALVAFGFGLWTNKKEIYLGIGLAIIIGSILYYLKQLKQFIGRMK